MHNAALPWPWAPGKRVRSPNRRHLVAAGSTGRFGAKRLTTTGHLSPIAIDDKHLLDAVGADVARYADGA